MPSRSNAAPYRPRPDLDGGPPVSRRLHRLTDYLTMRAMDGAPYIFLSHASADNVRLRCVLAALIDAGVPVWFDKPEHVDIGMARELFAGSVVFGDRSQPRLENAIAGAAGALVFPSRRALHSPDVMKEIGFARSVQRERGDDFLLLAGLLAPEDGDFEIRMTGGVHASSLFVEQDGAGGYRLTRQGLTSVRSLIAHIKAHFARLKSKRPAVLVPATDAARDYTPPYLIDRQVQRDTAVGAFHALERPPVFIVHGPEEQAPHRFTSVSLPRQVLARAAFFLPSEATGVPVRVRLPQAAGGTSRDFDVHMLRAMIDAFQGAQDQLGLDVWNSAAALMERVISAVRQDETTRLVASRVETEGRDRSLTKATIESWVRFWDAFPFHRVHTAQHFLLVPVLEVVHGRPGKGWPLGWMRGPDWPSLIDAASFAQKLSARSSNIRPCVLPALPSVTPACAREWIAGDELFAGKGEDFREELAERLCGLFDPDGGVASMSMRDWAKAAKPHLVAAGIS